MAEKKLQLSLVLRAVDQATRPLQRVGAAIQRVSRQTGLDRVGLAAQQVGRRLHRVGMEAGRFARRLGLGAIAGGAAAFGLTGRFAAAGDSIAKTADKLGFGVVELQRYRYAAELAGVEQQTFDMAAQRFTRRVAEAAAGTGEAEEALKHLGIRLRDTEGRIRPSGRLLEEVADRLAAIEDPALRVRLAFKLFDSEGVAMVNMLADGSRAMRSAGDEAERLGVITEAQARAAERYQDEMTRVRRSLSFLGHTIGAELLPVLQPLLERFREFAVRRRPEAVALVTDALDEMRAAGAWVVRTIRSLQRRVGAWLDALRLTWPAMARWVDTLVAWAQQASLVRIVTAAVAALLGRGLLLAVVALVGPLIRLAAALALVAINLTWITGVGIVRLLGRLPGVARWLAAAFGFGFLGRSAGRLRGFIRTVGMMAARLGALLIGGLIAFLPVAIPVAIALAIALAAWLIWSKWDEIKAAFKRWTEGARVWADEFWAGIDERFKIKETMDRIENFSLLDSFKKWGAGIQEWADELWAGIDEKFKIKETTERIENFSLLDSFKKWGAGIQEWVDELWADVDDAVDIKGTMAAIENFSLLDSLKKWGAGIQEWFRALWKQVTAELPSWLREAFGIDVDADAPDDAPDDAPSPRGRGQFPPAGDPPVGAPAFRSGRAPNVPSIIGPETRHVVGGEIRMRFEGLPRNARIEEVRSDNPDVPIDVSAGYSMAGAGR